MSVQAKLVKMGTTDRTTLPMAQLGTTEHAVLVLTILEVLALVLIRRTFKSAHGG